MIWFDDGFLNTYQVARDVMKKYKLVGIVAVITGEVGKEHYCNNVYSKLMGVEHLKTLIEEGWEIASHTSTHPIPYTHGYNFRSLNEIRTEYEMKKSKEWIITNLGVMPTKFVSPANIRPTKKQLKIIKRYYSFIRPFNARGLKIKPSLAVAWDEGTKTLHMINHLVTRQSLTRALEVVKII